MKKLVSIGALLFVLSAGNAMAKNKCVDEEDFCISVDDSYNMIVNEGAILVDVRTPEEWNYLGIPGENKIGEGAELGDVLTVDWLEGERSFLNDLKEDLENLEMEDGAMLIMMCRSGSRSYSAAKFLINLGYDAYSMIDGFEGDKDIRGYRVVNGWKVLGYPYHY